MEVSHPHHEIKKHVLHWRSMEVLRRLIRYGNMIFVRANGHGAQTSYRGIQ